MSKSPRNLVREEILHLREELESMEAKGALPPRLRALKDELARLRIATPESVNDEKIA